MRLFLISFFYLFPDLGGILYFCMKLEDALLPSKCLDQGSQRSRKLCGG